MAIRKSVAVEKVLERAVARLQSRPQAGAAELVAGGRKVASMLAALEDIAGKRNPIETPEAHALRLAKSADRLLAQVKAAEDADNGARTRAAQDIQARLDARTLLIDSPRGAEIRAWFRGLPSEERHAAMQAGIEARDGDMLGALLGAPSYLAGLSREQSERYRLHFERQVAPEIADEWDELLAADEAAATVRRVAREAAQEARDPAYIARIEADKVAAEAAQGSFDTAEQFGKS